MKALLISLLFCSTTIFAQNFSFFIDTNEVYDLQEYTLLPQEISISCNREGWRVSRMRVHVLNGRWPVAKIDIDTNRVNFGITSDSTKKLFANRRVLIEALAVKNEPGEERLVDEFASVNMQKCLGIQQVPFAAVYYNGERIDSSGQLNVVKSGGALQIRLFDEFSKWDVSKVQIIMARGKRPLGQFSNRISEQGLSRLAPGDRVFLFYTSVDIDVWEQGFQYVVELPVLSSEYKPSYVVQPMGLQCVL